MSEGSTEDDDTDTDSVRLAHSISPSPPSSPLPPSPSLSSHPPLNFQAEGAHDVHIAVAGPHGEIFYYPPGKSREQIDFEQGRIDYTGKHRFDFIQQALDRQLHLGEDLSQVDD